MIIIQLWNCNINKESSNYKCYSFFDIHWILSSLPPWSSSRILILLEVNFSEFFFFSNSVQSLSHVRLFVTPWTAARQASLSITNSQSPPRSMSIVSVMPSNHLILCHPLLLLPSIFPSFRVFSNASALHIMWPKYWSFSFNISPSNEHPGLISFRMESKGFSKVFSNSGLLYLLLIIKKIYGPQGLLSNIGKYQYRICRWHHPYGRKCRGTKKPLDESESESETVGLKLNIQKTKIMPSGSITSWQIDGETVETVSDFIFWGSKITAGGDCSHEIKRRLLLGRKVMTNLDSIFKSRDITLPTKVHLVKAMVFPYVWMWELDLKKAEYQRIDAFELWCWRTLLRVPWTAMRSNQSILKEIGPGCSLEGLMLKLKLQYFGHLLGRVDSLEKILMLRGIGGRRRREWQRMRWLDGITD